MVAPAKGNIKGKIYTTELIGDHTLVTVETERDKLTVKASKDFNGKQGDAIGVLDAEGPSLRLRRRDRPAHPLDGEGQHDSTY